MSSFYNNLCYRLSLACFTVYNYILCIIYVPSTQVRLHADVIDPSRPQSLAHSDKYLEVNVNGEWGLVCYDPLTRSDLTVLCRDLEGRFGQSSRPNTAEYYKGKKR